MDQGVGNTFKPFLDPFVGESGWMVGARCGCHPPAYSSSTPSELDDKDSEQVSKADPAYTLDQEPTEELLQTLGRGNAQHNHSGQKHNSMRRI